MKPSRAKVSAGIALLIYVAGTVTNPPAWVQAALVALALAVVVWGLAPQWLRKAVARIPLLERGFASADRLFDMATGASDPKAIAALQALYRSGVDVRTNYTRPTAEEWEATALTSYKEHVPSEAFRFEHCHEQNVGQARLNAKLEKLAATIQRLEAR